MRSVAVLRNIGTLSYPGSSCTLRHLKRTLIYSIKCPHGRVGPVKLPKISENICSSLIQCSHPMRYSWQTTCADSGSGNPFDYLRSIVLGSENLFASSWRTDLRSVTHDCSGCTSSTAKYTSFLGIEESSWAFFTEPLALARICHIVRKLRSGNEVTFSGNEVTWSLTVVEWPVYDEFSHVTATNDV